MLQLPDTTCYPRPLQEHVPVLVGGNGERRTLRLAAQYADACNVIGDVEVVVRKVAALHAHCDALDRDRAAVEVTQLSTTLVGRDRVEVDALVERLRPRRQGAERYAASVNAGTVTDHIGRFRALADAGVQTAIVELPRPRRPRPGRALRPRRRRLPLNPPSLNALSDVGMPQYRDRLRYIVIEHKRSEGNRCTTKKHCSTDRGEGVWPNGAGTVGVDPAGTGAAAACAGARSAPRC